MKARSAILYSVLRLLAFLVPFGLMMLLPIFQQYYWLAAIFAALIGLSLSIIFLRRPLADATAGLPQRAPRAPRRSAASADAAAEDAVVDAGVAEAGAPDTDAGRGPDARD